jgi:hypothetical protein
LLVRPVVTGAAEAAASSDASGDADASAAVDASADASAEADAAVSGEAAAGSADAAAGSLAAAGAVDAPVVGVVAAPPQALNRSDRSSIKVAARRRLLRCTNFPAIGRCSFYDL